MKHWTERQGVWVETDQGVGIRTTESLQLVEGVPAIKVGYIDMVAGDGLTTAARVPETSLSNVRLARRASIPACRIEGLSAESLVRLGYV